MLIFIIKQLISVWNSGAIQTQIDQFFNGIGPIIIMLIGIGILLSCIGIRVFHGMGSHIRKAIENILRFIFVTLIWEILITGIFRLVRMIFQKVRETLKKREVNDSLATLISVIVAGVALGVII